MKLSRLFRISVLSLLTLGLSLLANTSTTTISIHPRSFTLPPCQCVVIHDCVVICNRSGCPQNCGH